MKAIETRIYGCRFRSRLEARWAVALTEQKIMWEYEPEGFDLGDAGFYLPDFWLPQVSMWAEVKPNKPTDKELEKAAVLTKQSGFPCLLLIGKPANAAYWSIEDLEADHTAWEVSCGQVKAHAMDRVPFESSKYHLDENRFWTCTGEGVQTFPMPHDPWGEASQPHPAVDAALSARFEHGEAKRYRR